MSIYSSNSLAVLEEKAGVVVGDQDYWATINTGTGQAGELTKLPTAGTFALLLAGSAAPGLGYVRVQVPPTAAQILAGTTGTKYRLLLADDSDT
jgi:hypothetical protein